MIDAEDARARLLDGLVGVANRGLGQITGRAKELAPVRKVFAGQDRGYRTRFMSIEEVEADRAVRARLGLGPAFAHPTPSPTVEPARIVTSRAPQELTIREVAGPNRLRLASAQSRLDRRGRYELRTARAVFQRVEPGEGVSRTTRQLGGRLRDEIAYEPARIVDGVVYGRVVSPTPYAKFQEFGTRHNPAHPYLRPAGHENVGAIRADASRVAASVVRRSFAGARWESKVTMKATG